MVFNDHFSSLAKSYAEFRPSYPDALFKWLTEITPSQNEAWDCACGSGQASERLAQYFDHVTATDASAAQIAQAEPNPKITYYEALAENSGLPDHAVDLVTVAQAAHWFRHDDFYKEAKRVLKKEGVIALWTYNLLSTKDQPLMRQLATFFQLITPYWPLEREPVTTSYKTLPFPFEQEITAPAFSMNIQWSTHQLLGYFNSWSSVKYFKEAKKYNPVDRLEEAVKSVWPNPEETKFFHFPISMRVARV